MTRLRGKKKRVKDSEEEEEHGSESESESQDVDEDEDEEGDLGGQSGQKLDMFEGNKDECKLVLVVRTDLGMGKGEKSNNSPFPPRA